VQRQSGPFRLDGLIRHLKNEGLQVKKKTTGRLVDILHMSSLVLSRDHEEFVPRQAFFRGARFMVVPTPEEVRDGILIPGHKFLPFSSHEILPWSCTLIRPDGGAVPVRKVAGRSRSCSPTTPCTG
jgi:hypothetical protein